MAIIDIGAASCPESVRGSTSHTQPNVHEGALLQTSNHAASNVLEEDVLCQLAQFGTNLSPHR